MDAIVSRFGATALKRALLLGVIGALLTGFMVVNTVTVGTIGPTGGSAIKLTGQTFSDDSDITVVSSGIQVVGANTTAAGTTATGVEATVGLAAVNNTLVKGNYAYKFVVKESAVATWAATDGTDDLKMEVYGDNGTTTTLITTLYAKQAVADASNVEGVTGTVDLGSSSTIYDTFDVVVGRQ